MYDCLKEVLQTEEKLERFELEAAITSLRFGSSDIQSKALGEIYSFRGSWGGGGEGKEDGGVGSNLFQSFGVSVSLHSFHTEASRYTCGCLCLFVSTLNQNG